MDGAAKGQRSDRCHHIFLIWVGCVISVLIVFPLRSHAQTLTLPSPTSTDLLEPPAVVVDPPPSRSTNRDVESILKTPGSVTFRKSPLSEVIFSISDVWGVNIVAGGDINGEVTGSFQDVPLAEVLGAVLSANDYAYKQTGSSLVVLPSGQVGQDDATFASRVVTLPRGVEDPTEMVEAARLLLSSRGQIRPISGTGTIFVLDSAERVDRIEALFGQLGTSGERYRTVPLSEAKIETIAPGDVAFRETNPQPGDLSGGEIIYFTPQFTDAENLVEALQGAVDPSTIISLYAEENRIIVRGDAEQLRLASQIVNQLDRPRPQVRITALIYDVSLDDIANLGIDWAHGSGDGSLTTSAGSGLLATVADGATLEGTNMAISMLKDKFNLGVTINALNSAEGAKLLADPTITVSDRNEAVMKIVQKIPVTTIGQLGDSAATFSSVTFEEAGIILTVTPRISRDGTVQMVVQTEFSVLTGNLNGQPIIDTRTANTSVRVSNGQAFVLGGLRQKSVNEKVKGVPWLKDMRYVGGLFRSHETEVVESELIVFIKPEIVGPYDNSTPREQAAICVGGLELDRIPRADLRPFIPDCGDPNCPYHCPPRRVNGGGSAQMAMIGGFGIESLPAGFLPEGDVLDPSMLPGMRVDPTVMPQRQESRFGPKQSEPLYQTADRSVGGYARDQPVQDYSERLDSPVRF
ncbi:Type II secretion system protein D precursor [Roseimaritima multifibrata]|uniref:Type II secretion system protein D n=1 Tax=Roseimaritima multifibrata TaxID=1930274 RepID=A0A517M8W0_9BACT|nr:secretin N-terminal domain-containing protein [Roseimaritima multifibrata]QDS91322.1 Type II secretion system protein D precursor [Roseimaritima multifibrata]